MAGTEELLITKGSMEMWGKVITGIALITAMFSACCLDSAEWGKFMILFVVSMGWLVGAAVVKGYIYTE
jgi:hypothetical protein